jgi:hypothetical protein
MALLQKPGNVIIKPVKFDKFFQKTVNNYLHNFNELNTN